MGEAATAPGGENVSVRFEGTAAGVSRRSSLAWDRFHDGGVSALVTLLACGATVVLVLTAGSTLDAVRAEPAVAAVYLAIGLGLGLVNVEVYGRGTVSVGAIGLIAIGLALGPGPAAYAAVLVAFAAWLRLGGRPQRAMFNAGALAIAAAAGAEFFALVAGAGDGVFLRSTAALAAGTVFWLLNIGLLTLVMASSESLSPVAVWNERFRWLTPYYLAYGPLALASVLAEEGVGVVGLVAFTLPPAVLVHSMRQYLTRTRESVEQIRAVNERLATANGELASRNDDLRELLEFAGGLSQHAHDRSELVAYTERWLSRVTRGDAKIRIGPGSGGVPLRASGVQVGSLSLVDGDEERWERLRDAVLPHLATAIQNVVSVEEARRTHLATIAALSRSMEAKDYYTGGHTERVAALAVELGKRLGLEGEDLDALQIGALLHDVGKIGIPERILHKPGPLDPDEWEVMREHPVISDYILSEVELPPIVRQVARWSHERIDGQGYPDRLTGEAIPLAARIVLVADAFDAITSDRPYRPARDPRAALAELHANAGSQFCPVVVEALEWLTAERVQAASAAPLRAVS